MSCTQVFPAQANNAYIFPAVGHAAVITRCSTIPDSVFLEAAEALAGMSTAEQLQQGQLFPPLTHIRQACEKLTAHLAAFIVQSGLGQLPEGVTQHLDRQGWMQLVKERVFSPGKQGQQQQLQRLQQQAHQAVTSRL